MTGTPFTRRYHPDTPALPPHNLPLFPFVQVAELESRLKFTANNADSLATQLRGAASLIIILHCSPPAIFLTQISVINSHKEKIEKMLGDERESRLNSAKGGQPTECGPEFIHQARSDLESQLTSVREQYELIKVSELGGWWASQ